MSRRRRNDDALPEWMEHETGAQRAHREWRERGQRQVCERRGVEFVPHWVRCPEAEPVYRDDDPSQIVAWRPGPREREEFLHRTEREPLYAADWIDPGASSDELLGPAHVMALEGDERLCWYVANQPEAIVSEAEARAHARQGLTRGYGERGSVATDPWTFANV